MIRTHRTPRQRATAALAATTAVATAFAAVAVGTERSGAPRVAASSTTAAYSPVGPVRLADTRGDGFGLTRLDEHTIRVEVAGRGDVPADAVAAALTVTAITPTGDGYLTAHPAGTPRPEASNLNFRAGEVRANGALTRLGAGGAVDIHTSTPADVVVDVSGAFVPATAASAGRFVPVDPHRVLDTRPGERPAAGHVVTLTNAELGVPASASAVAVNLTAVDAAAPGHFTLWSAGAEKPESSVLNVDGAGQTRAAFAIVPTGADGAGISAFTSDGAHLLADVVGYFTGTTAPESSEGLFVPFDPERIFDTRSTSWKLLPRTVTRVEGVSSSALAVAANWTSVDAAGASWMTVYPNQGPPAVSEPPGVSTVNGDAGVAVANLAITPVGAFGVATYSFAGEHAVGDLAGYFTGADGAAPVHPEPPPPELPGSLPVPAAVPRPPSAQLGAAAVRLEPVLGINRLTGMEWSVLAGAYFAITQDGYVHRVPADLSGSEVVLDLSAEVSPWQQFSERGLLGITFDPVDGRMFLYLTDHGNDSHVVSYAVVDGFPVPASRRSVLFLDQPGLGHQGGDMQFDAHGNLYVAFGDGGGSAGRDAQDHTVLHGSIIRIVPNRDGDGYQVPADNPYVGVPDHRDELWATGLRNPWRFSIDPATGDMWIADVGEDAREEVNVVPAGTSGLNFGWYWFEGTLDRGIAGRPPGLDLVPPVFEYGRSDGVSVIGGMVYHGGAISALAGAYVFADMTGRFFAFGADGGTHLDVSGSGLITGFAETPERELLVLSLNGGLFRLLPA